MIADFVQFSSAIAKFVLLVEGLGTWVRSSIFSYSPIREATTAWKEAIFWVFLVRIFPTFRLNTDLKNSKYGQLSRSELIYSVCGDNDLAPPHLWWRETALKNKKVWKYFVKPRSIFLGKHENSENAFIFWKKCVEPIHKYCPNAITSAVSAKFTLA